MNQTTALLTFIRQISYSNLGRRSLGFFCGVLFLVSLNECRFIANN
jgi:hypothetical protein